MSTYGDLPRPATVPLSTTVARLSTALTGLPDNGYRSASVSYRNSDGIIVTMTLSATQGEDPTSVVDDDEEED